MDNLVRQALRDSWHYSISSLCCIQEEDGRRCYKALSNHGVLFVKIQKQQGEFLDDIVQGLQVQAYVSKKGILTNNVLPTIKGELYVKSQGYGIIVEPWVEKQTFGIDLWQLRKFGETVGHLHSLIIPKELKTCLSKLEPQRTLNTIRQRVYQCRDQVPKNYQSVLDAFCKTAEQLDDFPSITRSIIHTDLAWGNVVRMLDDNILLVDFEGAGIGPAIIDLVEVTTYLVKGPSASGPLMKDQAKEFYDGYKTQRRLSSEEIALFHRAHFYHQLYYLANSLGRGDYDFIRRMEARLQSWNEAVIDQLVEIASA